jgi:hypothetical protein
MNFLNNPAPKMYRFLKFAMRDVWMIFSSNVFFINNPVPNPDPKLRLKSDPNPEKKRR